MMERVLSVLAFATLCVFLAILVYRVPRLDLGAALAICILLCGYDLFLRDLRARRK